MLETNKMSDVKWKEIRWLEMRPFFLPGSVVKLLTFFWWFLFISQSHPPRPLKPMVSRWPVCCLCPNPTCPSPVSPSACGRPVCPSWRETGGLYEGRCGCREESAAWPEQMPRFQLSVDIMLSMTPPSEPAADWGSVDTNQIACFRRLFYCVCVIVWIIHRSQPKITLQVEFGLWGIKLSIISDRKVVDITIIRICQLCRMSWCRLKDTLGACSLSPVPMPHVSDAGQQAAKVANTNDLR